MSRLPAEWEVQPLYFSFDVDYEHIKKADGSVVIYGHESGRWIQSDIAFDL
jgi:hypothetical protein